MNKVLITPSLIEEYEELTAAEPEHEVWSSGEIRHLEQWIYSNQYYQSVAFAKLTALAVLSIMSGRSHKFGNNSTAIFAIAVGLSGSGKDSILSEAKSILFEVDADLHDSGLYRHAINDNLPASPESIHNALENNGFGSLLIHCSELDKLMSSQSSSSRVKPVIDKFLTIFDRSKSGGIMYPVSKAKKENMGNNVHQGTLTFIGDGVPSCFDAATTEEEIQGGWRSRLLEFRNECTDVRVKNHRFSLYEKISVRASAGGKYDLDGQFKQKMRELDLTHDKGGRIMMPMNIKARLLDLRNASIDAQGFIYNSAGMDSGWLYATEYEDQQAQRTAPVNNIQVEYSVEASDAIQDRVIQVNDKISSDDRQAGTESAFNRYEILNKKISALHAVYENGLHPLVTLENCNDSHKLFMANALRYKAGIVSGDISGNNDTKAQTMIVNTVNNLMEVPDALRRDKFSFSTDSHDIPIMLGLFSAACLSNLLAKRQPFSLSGNDKIPMKYALGLIEEEGGSLVHVRSVALDINGEEQRFKRGYYTTKKQWAMLKKQAHIKLES